MTDKKRGTGHSGASDNSHRGNLPPAGMSAVADRIRGKERSNFYDYSHDGFIPPMKIVEMVDSQWIQGDLFDRRNRGIFSMNFLTGGNGRFRQGDSEGEVNAGEVFLAHKGRDQVLATGTLGFLHKSTILADGQALDSFLAAIGLDKCDVVKPADARRVAGLFRRAWDEMAVKRAGFGMRLSLVLHEILMELGRSITTAYPAQIRAAIDYIKRNLHQPLALRQLCTHACISARHCSRLFQQHLGVAPMRFFHEQRMVLARHLLADTLLSIKQVAVSAGFEDSLYFSSRFKKHAGVSPKYYRRALSRKE